MLDLRAILIIKTNRTMQPRESRKRKASALDRPSPASPAADNLENKLLHNGDLADTGMPASNDWDIPEFFCPITREVMRDPVVAADHHTYEKTAITNWFQRSRTSPMTNGPVPYTIVYPNFRLQQAITLYNAEVNNIRETVQKFKDARAALQLEQKKLEEEQKKSTALLADPERKQLLQKIAELKAAGQKQDSAFQLEERKVRESLQDLAHQRMNAFLGPSATEIKIPQFRNHALRRIHQTCSDTVCTALSHTKKFQALSNGKNETIEGPPEKRFKLETGLSKAVENLSTKLEQLTNEQKAMKMEMLHSYGRYLSEFVRPTAAKREEALRNNSEKKTVAIQETRVMKLMHEEEVAPLPPFVCPLTHKMMEHPVVGPDGNIYEEKTIQAWLGPDGYVYDEKAVRAWMKEEPWKRDYLTPTAKSHPPLLPNHTLRNAIVSYKARMKQAKQWQKALQDIEEKRKQVSAQLLDVTGLNALKAQVTELTKDNDDKQNKYQADLSEKRRRLKHAMDIDAELKAMAEKGQPLLIDAECKGILQTLREGDIAEANIKMELSANRIQFKWRQRQIKKQQALDKYQSAREKMEQRFYTFFQSQQRTLRKLGEERKNFLQTAMRQCNLPTDQNIQTNPIPLQHPAAVLFKSGCDLYHAGDWYNALNVFRSCLEMKQDKTQVFKYLGLTEMKLADYFPLGCDLTDLRAPHYLRAIDHFTQYLRVEQKDAFIFEQRGRAYKFVNLMTEALRDYQTSSQIQSSNSTAIKEDKIQDLKYRGLAKLQSAGYCQDAKWIGMRPQYYREAVEYFTEYLRVEQKDAFIFEKRAEIYYQHLDLMKEALQDYETSLRIEPNNPRALYRCGNILHTHMGRSREALERMRQSLEIHPTSPPALLSRAEIYHALGETELALADLMKIDEKDAKDTLRPHDQLEISKLKSKLLTIVTSARAIRP